MKGKINELVDNRVENYNEGDLEEKRGSYLRGEKKGHEPLDFTGEATFSKF